MGSNITEQIKERLAIEEVVGKYVKLEKAGVNFKAKCPFHNERTPSFFVSPSRGGFYCFGCGAKGDIFTFVQEFEGLDFKGALKTLASLAGVELVKENQKVSSERENLFSVLDEAASYFEKEFRKSDEAKKYLEKRAVLSQTIEKWRIGFALNSWQSLFDFLRAKGIPAAIMERAGLIKPGKERGSYYDTFRGRVIFPIFDSAGRIIAFSGRILPSLDDGKAAKYLNSPDTPLFNKSEVLYGYDKAKHQIRVRDYTILVEGQMDLIMCHQAGYSNAVATSGTALTERHVGLLKRMSANLLMAYDADKAGLSATERGYQIALRAGMAVKAALLPSGSDPADLIGKSPEKWKEAVANSKHVIGLEVERLREKKASASEIASVFRKRLLPLLAAIPSPAEQSRLISEHKLSIVTGIREESLWEELRLMPAVQLANAEEGDKRKEISKYNLEKKIVGLLEYESLQEKPLWDVKAARKKYEEIVGAKKTEIERASEGRLDEILFEAEASYGDSKTRAAALEEFLSRLEEEYVREDLAKAMRGLYEAERAKDAKVVEKLLKECQILTEKLTSLRERVSGSSNFY